MHGVANVPTGQASACWDGFLKMQEKPELPVCQTGTSGFGRTELSPAAHADEGDRADLHPSGVWEREGEVRG